MPNFSSVSPSTRTPLRTVVLPLTAFADTWAGKPLDPVCVGLRQLTITEFEAALAAANEQARQWHVNHDTGQFHDEATAIVARDEQLMVQCIARVTCDCNDTSATYFVGGEPTARDALTLSGVRLLWDELLLLHVTTSAATHEASDAEVVEAGRLLSRPGAMARLSEDEQVTARTIVAHLLTKLLAASAATEDAQ
ncbi:MAG TPA: hypothetical protein VGG39_08790 [Polyangiaceae bacterium]|jgi:hypothetical protein